MSHRWTNFIKGPNLQDTVTSFSTTKASFSQTSKELQDGLEASHIYETIISQPSQSETEITWNSNASSATSVTRVQNQNKKPQSQPRPPINPSSSATTVSLPNLSTLLRLAERNDHGELAKILSCRGKAGGRNTNSELLSLQDEFGWTPLMVAACAGASESVKLLLRHGADWTLKDKKGLTAASLARKKNRLSICQLIENWEEELRQIQKREKKEAEAKRRENEKSREKEFCAPCQVETEDPAIHSKSIAHLLTTSEDVPEKIHYGIPESNVGFQILLKTGWDRDAGGLGPEGKGQKFPVKTILKQDRVGLGNDEGGKKRARITHFPPFDTSAVERQVRPEERIERKKTLAKKEDARRRTKAVQKEIDYRRELGSL